MYCRVNIIRNQIINTLMSPISEEVKNRYFDFSWRRDPKRFSKFYDLQQFRIKEILVISSKYDDFTIEEDSSYSEMLLEAYQGIFRITPPRISRVSSLEDAIEAVKYKKYDLVITMSRLYGINPFELGKKLKEIHPGLPVILLLTSITDIMSLPENRDGLDNVFLYRGDGSIFMTIVKIVEDSFNVDNDTRIGNTRVIILVEDSIQYYSIFLPLLYKEILIQTNNLIKEGVNANHRRLLIRGRPKILLAKSFEEAIEIYNKHSDYVLGVISDIAYPKDGSKNWNAGFELLKQIRETNPHMPFCLQSSDLKNKEKAHSLHSTFIHKHAKDLLKLISKYLSRSLGFGDFVFRDENGNEIARAKNLDDFPKVIKKIPVEAITRHAMHNHFSNWLYCRSEFKMANIIKYLSIDDFENAEDLRKFLYRFVKKAYKVEAKGFITEFSEHTFEKDIHFSKFGNAGSLGGKGRGLAFSGTVFGLDEISAKYDNISISIPDTIVITTMWYDKFIEEFNLDELMDLSDEEIQRIFLAKDLPKELRKFIDLISRKIKYPLAIRSSSLLEDSQYHPLAGVYQSYMISNNSSKFKNRAKIIGDTIKLVYASTFSKMSKSYVKTIGQNLEIEKMAVIIQKVVGEIHNDRYYPTFSGVARSYNFYAIDPVKPEDGVAYLAVGHGEIITSGKKVLTYCPKYPKILPTHSNPEQSLQSSQTEFMALDLTEDFDLKRPANLSDFDLDIARNEDKILNWLGATFDISNNYVRDGPHYKGPLIITMPFILKYNRFPISDIIIELLERGKEAMGTDVEIEFAVNLDYENERNHELYLLQIRPMVVDTLPLEHELSEYRNGSLMYSDKVLGNGVYENITDIVYVCPEKFNHLYTIEMQQEVAYYNKMLENRKYMLIGFGRWGTADRFLGVPVKWHEIDNAAGFAEVELENYQVDPSSGQHFFLNLISTKKAYFTIPWKDKNAAIDWDWIKGQEVTSEKKYIKHIELDTPLTIMIDGKKSEGLVIDSRKIN